MWMYGWESIGTVGRGNCISAYFLCIFALIGEITRKNLRNKNNLYEYWDVIMD